VHEGGGRRPGAGGYDRTVSSPEAARPAIATGHPARLPLAVVAGLFIATLGLRPQVIAVGPLAPLIRDDLGITAAVDGLLTTIPVLCMGLFAPVGPRLAAWLGPRLGLAACLGMIAAAGLLRAVAPTVPLLVVVTLVVGIGIGVAGPIPAMVVADRLPRRRALGTGAYAGGIVLGSTFAAAVAVPLAGDDDWRRTLALLSLVAFGSLAAWLVLVPAEPDRSTRPPALQLPWRSSVAWLLVLVFGLQSALYYGVIAWLPNVYVERGWDPGHAGSLLAVVNAIGLIATLGVPLVADRYGSRRLQLLIPSIAAGIGFLGILALPDAAIVWAVVLGLSLGAIFPLVLTLPLDVAHEAASVGSVTALMLLGGYVISSASPIVLGYARDATGAFTTSIAVLIVVAVALVACCLALSPARLHHGVD
jgi:CP family cyanate transporter-like MFS transporter